MFKDEKISKFNLTKEDDDYFSLRCTRKISKYFTILLLHTNISANQVTIIDILLGILSAVLFSFGHYSLSVIAAFTLQLWYIFDCVDGEVARARNQCTSEGLYLDYVGHDIVQPIVYIGIGFGVISSNEQLLNMQLHGNYWILFLSFICCHFSVLRDNMMSNRFRIFFSRISQSKSNAPREIKMIPRDLITETLNKKNNKSSFASSIIPYYIKLRFIFVYPFVMNAITIAAIFKLLPLIVIFYGITLPLLWLLSVFRTFKSGVEKDGMMLYG